MTDTGAGNGDNLNWEKVLDSPWVDVEEVRGEPVPHTYVHGGFGESEARFSIYLPKDGSYAGRFFQHFSPVPDVETRAQELRGSEDRIGFAFSSGGYFVETNQGGVSGGPGSIADPTVAGYRVNAAAATFSRAVAQRIYGPHRPFGYAYGGSGGAFRTFGAAENTEGVWDGFVPYVAGTPMAAPNGHMVRMHAQRILRERLDDIADAMEPGGSGDPFATLNDEESDALREVSRMGFPIRSWFGHKTMGTQAFGLLYPIVASADPEYFDVFWTKPGYLGADPESSVHRDRVQLRTTVVEVLRHRDRPDLGDLADLPDGPGGGVDEAFKGDGRHGDTVLAVRLAALPGGWVRGAELRVNSGAASGTSVSLRGISADLAVIDFPESTPALQDIVPGDGVELDNSNFLAAQTYHRHQVPDSTYAPYEQFRNAAGSPLFPQRPFLLAPLFAAGAAGHIPTGRFHGKMILVESLLDREAYPWQADWYRARAAEHFGAKLDDHFRLWFTDNALHGDLERQEHPTHTVSYLGVLHEALRDLAEWVERDVPAPLSSHYKVVDGQVELDAHAPGGVQPSLALYVNGSDVAKVAAGEPFEVTLRARVSPGVGTLVRILWDLDGDGEFELDDFVVPVEETELSRMVAIDTPGTWFVAVQASAHRDSDSTTPFARIDNVVRARVIVA